MAEDWCRELNGSVKREGRRMPEDGGQQERPQSSTGVDAFQSKFGSLKSTVRPLFAALALGFVLYAGRDLLRRWDSTPVSVDGFFFATGCVFAAVAMLLQLAAFRFLLQRWSGRDLPFWKLGRLYLDSQMARYTPGKVGLLAVRLAGASRFGLSKAVMGGSLLVELLSWCAAGILLALVSLVVLSSQQMLTPVGTALMMVALLGCVLAVVILTLVPTKSLPGRVRRLLPIEHPGPVVPPAFFALHLLHFVAWMVSGWMMGSALGADFQRALLIGALVPLSVVVGFLALLAPAGVGVREAVLTSALSSSIGPAKALALGLLLRSASLGTDVLLWVCFRLGEGKKS